MEAPRHLEIATFKWYDDIINPSFSFLLIYILMFCRAAQSDPAGPKSFLKVELNLSHACSKDIEPTPSALLCCVLQALAIQGELQNKIKLFSKCTCQCCINLINY